MIKRIKEDIATVFGKDPAARTILEVLTCYPGLHAIWFHRAAHWLWDRGFTFMARFVSHLNRWFTGIEIHPGAKIGRRFFIDHGMGIVIGETSEIGDDVLMYQGAVLGGTSLEKIKRHPTIGNSVVIGAGATILGPILIGDKARIGAGSVVVKPVPEGAMVVGVPGHVAGSATAGLVAELEHGKLPDPVLKVIGEVLDLQGVLEERVQELERRLAIVTIDKTFDFGNRSTPEKIDAVYCTLKEIDDPEVGINVVDLGLIREVSVNGKGIEVRMVLTSPDYPMAGYLVDQIRRKVKSIARGEPVEVVLVDDVWSWNDAAPHLAAGQGI